VPLFAPETAPPSILDRYLYHNLPSKSASFLDLSLGGGISTLEIVSPAASLAEIHAPMAKRWVSLGRSVEGSGVSVVPESGVKELILAQVMARSFAILVEM
jgi:hypothetical protein